MDLKGSNGFFNIDKGESLQGDFITWNNCLHTRNKENSPNPKQTQQRQPSADSGTINLVDIEIQLPVFGTIT